MASDPEAKDLRRLRRVRTRRDATNLHREQAKRLQDLLMGYPMAGLLVVGGIVLLNS